MKPPAAESVPASPGVTLFPTYLWCRRCSLANPGVWFGSGELIRGWGDPGPFSGASLVQRGAVTPCTSLGWLWVPVGPHGSGLRGVPAVGWQHTCVVLGAEQGRAGAVVLPARQLRAGLWGWIQTCCLQMLPF